MTETKENPPPKGPVPQVKEEHKTGVYVGAIKALQGARARVRVSHLQPQVVIAAFDDAKIEVEGRRIGPDWKPLLKSDFSFNDEHS